MAIQYVEYEGKTLTRLRVTGTNMILPCLGMDRTMHSMGVSNPISVGYTIFGLKVLRNKILPY